MPFSTITMKYFFVALLVDVLCFTSSCQSPPTSADEPSQAAISIAGAPTEATAKTLLSAYLQKQPQAALYQLDSMRILDVDTHWQVLVPRTDWAERMPNAAAFDIDKQSGRITTRQIK